MIVFLQRLRQRKLVQWTLAYLAGAWVLLQVLDLVGQQFAWPAGLLRGITVSLGIGVFVMLLLAWYHGERGMQRVSGPELLLLAVLLAIGGGLLWRFARSAPSADGPVNATATRPQRAPAVAIDPRSIAVLPLLYEGGDPDNQYFSDGLSEELISRLTQVDALKVIGRSSSFQFRGSGEDSASIGRKLGVATLLEGSVRRQDDRLRIRVGLIKAADGSSLWSQSYDREMQDLFAVQSEIAEAVAGALQVELLGARPATSEHPPGGSLDAYNAYLQGNFHAQRGTEAAFRKAIDHYQDAIALDPRYARAHAALALAWVGLGNDFLGGAALQQAYGRARAAADSALVLAPDLATAHMARGAVLFYADWEWARAETEFRRALQLAPHDGDAKDRLGRLLATLGQPQQALDLIQQALASDPLHYTWYYRRSVYLLALGRVDAAEQAIRDAIELQPEMYGNHQQLATVLVVRGDAAGALQAAQQGPGGIGQETAVAQARQIGGDRAAADASLQALIDTASGTAAYQIAGLYALRKQPRPLFAWLERARANRDPGVFAILYDPFLQPYRHDPRFAAFGRKLGLSVPAAQAQTASAASPLPQRR